MSDLDVGTSELLVHIELMTLYISQWNIVVNTC